MKRVGFAFGYLAFGAMLLTLEARDHEAQCHNGTWPSNSDVVLTMTAWAPILVGMTVESMFDWRPMPSTAFCNPS